MNGPHQGEPVLFAGAELAKAKYAMVMVHGRGASADSILSLASYFSQPDFVYAAPSAAGNTWYPYPFTAPIANNEPYLSSALQAVSDVMTSLEEAGIAPERTMLLGFSQGACLSLEYAARNARRYGGVIGLSGGVIGPDGAPREYPGSLDGTPVFLGCSDVDFHIPVRRVKESSQVMRDLAGEVTERIYPGMGHTINEDEIAFIRDMMAALASM